jgi:TolB-like protein/Tfp pilus assembly protein PilF
MVLPLPDKPSIAVLPFANLSGDPKQDYLGDGISENITTALSRLPTMFVIARTSTLAYKGKAVKVQQVAEQLGVRYVLEGSVQKSGDKVRVTAQLIDALSGQHVWAKSYDREVKDILALQDDITLNVIVALEVNLVEGGGARIQRGNTTSIEAYQLVRRATLIFRRLTRDGNVETGRLAEQALKLDPNYTLALFFIGYTHLMSSLRRWSPEPDKELARAEQFAQKILTIDPNAAVAYLLLSSIANAKGRHDQAVAHGRKAHALAPNDAMIAGLLGYRLTGAGQPEEALTVIEKANRLTPNGLHPVLRFEGIAYYALGRIDKAIASFERSRKIGPRALDTHAWLALTYGIAGRIDEAQAAARRVLKLAPRFSARRWMSSTGVFDTARSKQALEILVKLGLSEKSPLKAQAKPSIAVLPFANISGDKAQDYFATGMAEDLITSLSKLSALFVVARKSSFRFKGQNIDVKRIGRELDVKYLLEGSVRRAGDQVRINAQLIDTQTGGQIWAERYDGKHVDTFALQDRITARIVDALSLKLGAGERARLADHGTNNFEAHDAFLKGQSFARQYTSQGFARAIAQFELALKLDPNYARAAKAIQQIRYIRENSGLK